MIRWILGLIFASLLVCGISIAFAPLGSFYAIRSAARTEDVQDLASLVDYDQLRDSLKSQISGVGGIIPPTPNVLDDPLGAVGSFFNPAEAQKRAELAAPVVETYLTPRALYGLTLGEGRAANLRKDVQDPATSPPFPMIVFWGLNRTRLSVPGSQGETIFTFKRGTLLDWKLTHIQLPKTDPAARPLGADPASKS